MGCQSIAKVDNTKCQRAPGLQWSEARRPVRRPGLRKRSRWCNPHRARARARPELLEVQLRHLLPLLVPVLVEKEPEERAGAQGLDDLRELLAVDLLERKEVAPHLLGPGVEVLRHPLHLLRVQIPPDRRERVEGRSGVLEHALEHPQPPDAQLVEGVEEPEFPPDFVICPHTYSPVLRAYCRPPSKCLSAKCHQELV